MTTKQFLLTVRTGFLSLIFTLAGLHVANAQGVAVGENNATPDPSAMLDVQSVTRGMLIPRMTESQRLAIAAPANGLTVYQTQNTPNSRRGYWYYDTTEPGWIHLGRGEYTGVIQQPNTILTTSHDPILTPLETGKSQIAWFLPTMSVAPTILVTPEYTVVGTPPTVDEYCQPEPATCSNFGRLSTIKVGFPDASYTGGNIAGVYQAQLRHHNCIGANNVRYKYKPWDGLYYTNTNEFNSTDFDLCTHPPEIAFLIQSGTSGNNKSFSFWIDANQDGDYSDVGELMATYDQIPANHSSIYYAFGTILPASPGPNYAPVSLPVAILTNGTTKMRIMVRENLPPITNACYPGDGSTMIYDMDVKILCGGAGAPLFPSDLNWCNVDEVTTFGAKVSCFNKNGTPTDMKFHYKIIEHD